VKLYDSRKLDKKEYRYDEKKVLQGVRQEGVQQEEVQQEGVQQEGVQQEGVQQIRV